MFVLTSQQPWQLEAGASGLVATAQELAGRVRHGLLAVATGDSSISTPATWLARDGGSSTDGLDGHARQVMTPPET
jgi:hypothetical protein